MFSLCYLGKSSEGSSLVFARIEISYDERGSNDRSKGERGFHPERLCTPAVTTAVSPVTSSGAWVMR